MKGATMHKNKPAKQEVYFIATKYQDRPTKVAFYTESGREVPEDKVEKHSTKLGVKLYTFASNVQ